MLPFAVQAAEITDIRYGARDDMTRIVLETSRALPFKTGTLANPPRIVLDLPTGTQLSQYKANDPTRVIKQVRAGSPNDQTARIVFDLNRPVTISKNFTLAPNGSAPHRIVLDVQPTSTMPNTFTEFEKTASSSMAAPSYPVATGHPLPAYRPDTISRQTAKKYLIAIDAGHGGGDPGGLGFGAREKDIVLALAKNLRKELESSGRYKILMTRDSDHYIKLRDRFRKARAADADLFISIHADKIHIPTVRGASVYTLSETASDTETARLARQANNAGVVAGVDLAEENDDVANILLDLVRRESMNESKLFADLLVVSMGDQGIRLLNNTHRFAGFAVLKAPDIPSVLIEAGFISNKHDARMLQSHAYRKEFSISVRKAIDRFFNRIERLERG